MDNMNSGNMAHSDMNAGAMAHPDDPSKASEHQALLNLVPIETVTHTAIASGDWFDPNTWEGGVVPAAGAIVHIPENISVTYEGSSNTPLFAVRVDGNLTFTAANGIDTKIVVDTLYTTAKSHFAIDADATTDGTVDIEIRPFDIEAHEAMGALGWNTATIDYYSDGATVTDTGARTRSSQDYETVDDGVGVLGRYNWDPKQLSLGIITHGAVRIDGREKLSKTTVSGIAMAGDTSINLEEAPHGWQVGDEIVIVGTHYVGREAGTGESLGSQDEVRTITQINGNTVTFDRALDYNHDTPREDLDAYVTNLTRNVKVHSSTDISIEGVLEADDAGDVATTLGHVMFMHNEDVRVRYAAFDDLGRTNKNDVLDDFQRKGFDGLDAERKTQNGEWVATPDNEITNIRGRYAVHLHRAGATATDTTALIEGSVVTGGPGWGFVSHDSSADFYDNVTYGVLGAGFMAETGNETGTWARNIAINTYGADYNDRIFTPAGNRYSFENNSTDLTTILEKRGAWKNHDMGHFGNGFWFQGKLIDVIDNVSANSGLDGYFFMFRAPDQINVDPEVLVEPLSVHSPDGIHPFAPGLNVFVGNESIADTRGLEMIGIGGGRTNDERSVINNFTAWEVGDVGTGAQYYPGYTIKNSTFIASTSPEANAADGVLWRQVQVDTVLANLEIIGFDQQYDLRKKWSGGTVAQQGFEDPYTVIKEALANGEPNPLPNGYAHVLIDPGFTAAEAQKSQFMGRTFDRNYDLILTSADLDIGRFDIELDDSSLKIDLDNKNITYGTGAEDPIRPTLQEGHVLLLKGTKTDSIGSIPIDYLNNTLVWHEDALQHRLETFGYHQMANGSIGVILAELFSDRYTAEKHIVQFVAELDPRWEIADGVNLGVFNPVDYPEVYVPRFLLDPNGISLFDNSISPTATADKIDVYQNSTNNAIEILANDTSFGDGLASLSADLTSIHGGIVIVDDRGTDDPTDDRILYTPDPNFSGIDTFSYTITGLNANTDTADVTVNVAPYTSADTILRIAVGGGEFTDINGNFWAADRGFFGGTAYYKAQEIANTDNDEIHYGKRAGENFSYKFELPNATYDVVLHFMDPKSDARVGSRVFDVYAENNLRLDDYDIMVALDAQAAPRTAISSTLTNLEVIDGTLNLDFSTVAGLPVTLSGIEIFSVDSTPVNLIPIAIPDTVTVVENSINNAIDVLKNDTNYGDGLSLLSVDSTSVSNGTVTVDNRGTVDPTDDQILYSPADNFKGIDTFSYTITDINGDISTAAVSVTVDRDSLFSPTLGKQIGKLVTSDAEADDRFGQSVAFDGNTIVIGARNDDDAGSNSGSAYIFNQEADGNWKQTAKLTADDAASGDQFGVSIGIDGNTIVIGARNDDDNGSSSGAAYIFTQQADGNWTQTAKLTADDAASGDEFGSVSVSGNKVVIGAFGDDDGGSDSGAAYIFTQQADGSWTQTAKLTADDAASGDEFGRRSIAISGNTVLVGARGDDDGGSDSGAAYIFTQQADGSWTQTAKLTADDAASGDLFGMSVSIYGNTAVVGSRYDDDKGNNSGSVYIFTRQTDGSWTQTAKITPDDGASSDEFGYAVSIKDDILIIGAWRDRDDAGSINGSAYIFSRQAEGSWTQTAKLTADDAAHGDSFGYSATIDKNGVVIGAFGDDDGGSSSGSAYIFSLGDNAFDNSIPIAVADTVTVNENSINNVINVLANDTDFGDGLASLSADAVSANGSTIAVDDLNTADGTDDLLIYTPATNFSGTDTFSYSIADSNGDVASAEVSVTVNPTPTSDPEALLRIDVGGSGFTDIDGNVWQADYGFQGGVAHYRIQPIAGTDNDEIFYGKRYGKNIAYDLAIENGTYDVVIHMMEPKHDAAVGRRVFDVYAENELTIDDYDIWAAMGSGAATKTAVTATLSNINVTDGSLNLNFASEADSYRPVNFAGIEIFST